MAKFVQCKPQAKINEKPFLSHNIFGEKWPIFFTVKRSEGLMRSSNFLSYGFKSFTCLSAFPDCCR